MEKFVAIALLLVSFVTNGEESDKIPGRQITVSVAGGETKYWCEAEFPDDPINASLISARLELACKKEALAAAKSLLDAPGVYLSWITTPVSADYHRSVLWLQIILKKTEIPVEKSAEDDNT